MRTRIGGHRVAADRWLPTVNPFSGAELARVPACSAEHVDLACAAAMEALGRADFSLVRRAEVLDSAARLLAERAEEYARTVTLESGKPLAEARQETARSVDALRLAAAEARLLDAEPVALRPSPTWLDPERVSVASRAMRLTFAVREPVGVVGVITPFPLPLELVARRLGVAVAAGCPVVLKPSSRTPLTAIRFVDLLVEAGLPEDWVSVVTGPGAEVGAALVAHAVPRLVAFTGSPAVGHLVASAAGSKRVMLSLGSNAPVIVQPDADLTRVAELVARDAFAFAGQQPNAPQRVIAHEDVLDELVERLVAATASLAIGDPMLEHTHLGPLIDHCAADRTTTHLADAVAGGGRLAGRDHASADGHDSASGHGDRHGTGGAVLRPSIVVNPPLTSSLWREQVLGPVVSVVGYDDFGKAVAIANESAIRNQVGLFTHDVQLVVRAAHELDFAGVLVNEPPSLDLASSGHEVRDLTELRYVLLSA